MRLILSLFLPVLLGLAPARAHEFWISPETYQLELGQPITLTTRIGENFKAGSRPFLPNGFTRFEAVWADLVRPITGRMGDDPVQVMMPEGLVILVYESRDRMLSYSDPEKWPAFVAHKDFPGALARHEARGFGLTGFRERYRRFAKALVAVGAGEGADRALGLRTEIVALENPYAGPLTQMPVQILIEGAPRAEAQVELFEKAPDGAVRVTLHRTDGAGRALLPVRPGHRYLVDAVVLVELENDDPEAGPVWETLWAALTFALP